MLYCWSCPSPAPVPILETVVPQGQVGLTGAALHQGQQTAADPELLLRRRPGRGGLLRLAPLALGCQKEEGITEPCLGEDRFGQTMGGQLHG